MPIDVGVYVRISDDSEGEAKGVARQRDDCCALAVVRRWEVARVYEDNDFSAYQRHVVRPEFERMLEDLHLGVIKGVVVYNLDRFARQPRDLERAIDIFEARTDYVFATLEGDINLASTDGRTLARVMVAFANKSSADTGRRVMRKQLELASEGKPHGGRQPYGWQADGLTADPDAKREIRAAHRALLAGAKISDIQKDWLIRGVAPTSRAGRRFKGAERLDHKTVRRILTNPALAGVKVYKGEVVLGDDGAPIKAAWDALCTSEQLSEVIEALEGRRPNRERPGTNALRYLLSGIARCGVCNGPMRGQMRRRAGGDQYQVYLCDRSGYAKGCGKIARVGAPVDRLVEDLVLADQKRVQLKVNVGSWSKAHQERLSAVLDDISQIRAACIAKKVSVATVLDLLSELEHERNQLALSKRRAERQGRKAAVVEHTRETFKALPLERQRALVLHSLKAVVIHPQGKGVARFNPDLIEPVWAE
jgi:DNA invertase Pin-like site-specific DNA recombinase